MGDGTQGGLVRKIEETVSAMQMTTSVRVREVKIWPGGGVTVIINDERRYVQYMKEIPMFLEDQMQVADLNIPLKSNLKDPEQETGKCILQITEMRTRPEKAEKEYMPMREVDKKVERKNNVFQK